ncbi:MAG: hypothetical protein ACYCW6_27670, partial [Candidatus Xenobia bacterium]
YENAGIGMFWQYSGAWLGGLGVCLLSPGKSLFIFNPILLVSMVGLVLTARRIVKQEFFPILLYGTVNGIATLHLIHWVANGEISWGPRFFAHTIFIGILPAWYALHHVSRAWFRNLVLMAGIVGLAVQLLGTLYASELDYGAIRDDHSLYGVNGNAVAMSWVPILAWRAGDVATLIRRGHPFVPERFHAFKGSDKCIVPQWWCVRLWHFREYGVPRGAVLAAGAFLLTMLALGILVVLLALRTAMIAGHARERVPQLASLFPSNDDADEHAASVLS